MAQRMKLGYCNWCAHNTDHGRYAGSAAAGLFHGIVRIFAAGTGYGPWYCGECRRVVVAIELPVESQHVLPVVALDAPIASDARRPLAQAAPPQATATVDSDTAARYSQKYRNAVVRKILAGDSTFNQVSAELSINKKEVWTWVVELFANEQRQVAALKRQVRNLEERLGRDTMDAQFNQTGDLSEAAKAVNPQWSTVVVGAQLDGLSSPSNKPAVPKP